MIVFEDLKKYKKIISLVLTLTFANALGELFLPRYMSKIVDIGIVNNDIPYILKSGGVMIVITILTIIVRGSAAYYSAKAAMLFSRDLRYKIFNKVNDMTFDDTEIFGISSLITRTTNDVGNIEQLVLMSLRPLARAPLMIIGGLSMSLAIHVQLTLVVLIAFPFLAGILYYVMKGVIPYFPVLQARLDRMNLLFRQRLTGLQVTRAFSNDAQEEEIFNEASQKHYELNLKLNKDLATIRPLMVLFLNIAIIAVIYFGSRFVLSNTIQIGQLMAFIQYITQMLSGFIMLSYMLTLLPRTSASIHRVEEVITYPIHKTGGNHSLDGPIQSIKAMDLTFNYPYANHPALDQLNFEIFAGESVGIIGGTGSGKSTLLKLLLQFYEPTSGTLEINHCPIQSIKTKELRQEISYLPQQIFFFSDSIRGNMQYSNKYATDERILNELATAQTQSFLNLSDKKVLDQEIYRGGANFSGGQRQRLAIARALSRDASLYLFDDSFSALDFRTDYHLRKKLHSQLKNKITIIVAQRVATIRQMDKIFVLNDGRLVGVGTHDELLKHNKIYQEIAISQGEEGVAK
ncbi:ABC transporter ATP-binding protein [Allofustis seminis]|uniref:ABC transporter ATP-binding protein n=1 Tax=Allofustis seminis TaxID=166939 RepID=UPI00037720A4|nr:ABC transporter ATP-binding protein [Allofustis seminis]